jgi:putative ABC transport system permease protein
MRDLGPAVRALAKRPGFTLIAIVTLALGIGSNITIFSVVDSALIRPLPYPRSERLAVVWGYSDEVQQRTGLDRLPWSPGDVDDFIQRGSSFEHLSWVRADRVNLTGVDEPERLAAVRVGRHFFDALRVQARHGRTFTDEDVARVRVVVIAESVWRRRFGADPGILTRAIPLNGTPHAVVGVMPDWFRFPAAGDLPQGLGFGGTPEVWTLDVLAPEVRHTRAGKSFVLLGRLRDGVPLHAAATEAAGIADTIARDFPNASAGWTARVLSLRDQLVGAMRPALVVLLTAVGFLLLIACANVANLLLVRASARQREVCVRQALGAERHQLIRQFLTESIVLGLVAGLAGLGAAWYLLRGVQLLLPSGLPMLGSASIDTRVMLFALLLSIATGLLFGLAPAMQTTRLDVCEGLREGARGTVGGRRARRTRNVLVATEVASALVLVVAAVLLLQTFVRLINVDPGFRGSGVLTAEIALPRGQYAGSRAAQFFDNLLQRMAAVPGIEAAAASSSIPLAGQENLRQITIEGYAEPAPGQEIIADYRVVTSEYFRAMGIALIDGEPLHAPGENAAPSVVISRTMADTWFRGQNPVGRRIKLTRYDQDAPWFTVRAVVADTHHTGLDATPRPQVYVHHRADPFTQMIVVLRTSSDPSSYGPLVRSVVRGIDGNQPVGRIRTMNEILDDSVARQRFTMFLVAMFAALALALAVVGLYAVVSHSVAERIPEMGLRVALGASPSTLVRMVLAESMRVVLAGIAFGLVVAFVVMRSLETLLYGVRAYDPLTFILVPVLLLAAACAGSLVPAMRATRVDPMVVLRSE